MAQERRPIIYLRLQVPMIKSRSKVNEFSILRQLLWPPDTSTCLIDLRYLKIALYLPYFSLKKMLFLSLFSEKLRNFFLLFFSIKKISHTFLKLVDGGNLF